MPNKASWHMTQRCESANKKALALTHDPIMNRLLIALCVFGLVAVAFAKPGGDRKGSQKWKGGPAGQKGGKGGREGGRGADLVCEVTSDTFSMTKEKSDEEDVDVAEGDDDEVAPEAIVAGQKGGKGRKPSKRRH
ncbi:hypothetical protein CAPTEDRAFT_188386 [Capitella teleta]|uniref:Uncharacterized protein n=1 Tax=Capitella teleta TaxID=283909 RepID=R7TSD3_CAPTE|nr:hypothetical protein CAPTEDRAFT_188386 [Capitella teleta]|eukprot:ELT96569.1 hypothetical protein CAPTEDRAFT_188386 [Capitella teleta]